MARIIPQDVQTHALQGRQNPELVTLKALQKSLPNGYTIFHSLHWARETARGTAIGEIDFIILNQSGAALLIEQKTGKLVETDQGLRKDYTDNSKSVAEYERAEARERAKRVLFCGITRATVRLEVVAQRMEPN